MIVHADGASTPMIQHWQPYFSRKVVGAGGGDVRIGIEDLRGVVGVITTLKHHAVPVHNGGRHALGTSYSWNSTGSSLIVSIATPLSMVLANPRPPR